MTEASDHPPSRRVLWLVAASIAMTAACGGGGSAAAPAGAGSTATAKTSAGSGAQTKLDVDPCTALTIPEMADASVPASSEAGPTSATPDTSSS